MEVVENAVRQARTWADAGQSLPSTPGAT